eukprot:12881203-Prorocentrum_lima.AAC.1
MSKCIPGESLQFCSYSTHDGYINTVGFVAHTHFQSLAIQRVVESITQSMSSKHRSYSPMVMQVEDWQDI